MTMPGDSEELVELAEAALRRADLDTNDPATWYRDRARAVVAALSGRLVPEGSEVREEWSVAIDVDYALDARDEARARHIAEREGGTVESRRVITTPWTPTETEEKPDA